MTTEKKDFRLDGIYYQRQEGFFMQRVKLPAGVISSHQARLVSEIADTFGQGSIHLTTRGSMELHWLKENDLPEIKRVLATVGLTSRGACGGAVRGITCASQGFAGFPLIESLARRLQRHFAGNPRFERLPKKFKIGIEADSRGRRHLIQDVGLVLVRTEAGRGWYDVWVAGGLGREPQPGILFASAVVEERIIPLIEAILRVYAAGTAPGKRLKHLLRDVGEEELRRRIDADPASREELPSCKGFPEILVPATENQSRRADDKNLHIEARFFAGGLSSTHLRHLADFADTWSDGVLLATADQNIALQLAQRHDPEQAKLMLAQAGFTNASRDEWITFRVCPGAHECRAGLAATRDIARAVLEAMGPTGEELTWAISGCHNSCTQPQLADVGIVTSSLVTEEDSRRTPRFDLYRPAGERLNQKQETGLSLEELIAVVKNIG
jgi:sulfite reductase (ferredoxin)